MRVQTKLYSEIFEAYEWKPGVEIPGIEISIENDFEHGQQGTFKDSAFSDLISVVRYGHFILKIGTDTLVVHPETFKALFVEVR